MIQRKASPQQLVAVESDDYLSEQKSPAVLLLPVSRAEFSSPHHQAPAVNSEISSLVQQQSNNAMKFVKAAKQGSSSHRASSSHRQSSLDKKRKQIAASILSYEKQESEQNPHAILNQSSILADIKAQQQLLSRLPATPNLIEHNLSSEQQQLFPSSNRNPSKNAALANQQQQQLQQSQQHNQQLQQQQYENHLPQQQIILQRQNHFQKIISNQLQRENERIEKQSYEDVVGQITVRIPPQHSRSNYRRQQSLKQAGGVTADLQQTTFKNLKEIIKQQQIEFKAYLTLSNPAQRVESSSGDESLFPAPGRNSSSPDEESSSFHFAKNSKHNQQNQKKQTSQQNSSSQQVTSQQYLSTSHETSKLFDEAQNFSVPSWPSQFSQPSTLLFNSSKIQPQQIRSTLATKEDSQQMLGCTSSAAAAVASSSFEVIYGGMLKSGGFNATHPTPELELTSKAHMNNINNLANDTEGEIEGMKKGGLKNEFNRQQKKKTLSIISDFQFDDMFEQTPIDLQLCPKCIDTHSKHPFESSCQQAIPFQGSSFQSKKGHQRSQSEKEPKLLQGAFPIFV